MPLANSGLPVLDGWVPASNLRKSRLSACSAGREPVAFVTTSGASMPASTGRREVRRERGDDLVVGAHRCEEEQPGVVVEHRQPGGVLLAPGEIDAQVAHFRSLHPWGGPAGWRARGQATLIVLLVVALAVGTTTGGPAASAPVAAPVAAPPVHQVSVSGTGVGTYPAFDPSISRYAVTTTAATAGTVTVTATTSDPAGVVTVNGRIAPGARGRSPG